MNITHWGEVEFVSGDYPDGGVNPSGKKSGSGNWKAYGVEGFGTLRLPLGQVQIEFSEEINQSYTVLVSARRISSTPSLTANYGDVTEAGFVVHLWETNADRTVQNGSFSFAVLCDD